MITKKVDLLDKEEVYELLSWKAIPLLKQYTTRFDTIKPRKFTTHSVRKQKELRKAIIRAREIGLLPYN